MRSSSFLFIVSSVDAACFTTSESSFKRRSFVRCKAFLEAKTKRCRGIGTLLHGNAFETKEYQLKTEPQHKDHNSSRLFLLTRISSFSRTAYERF